MHTYVTQVTIIINKNGPIVVYQRTSRNKTKKNPMKAAKKKVIRMSSLNPSPNSIIYYNAIFFIDNAITFSISNLLCTLVLVELFNIISTANLPEIKYIYKDSRAKATSGEGSPV